MPVVAREAQTGGSLGIDDELEIGHGIFMRFPVLRALGPVLSPSQIVEPPSHSLDHNGGGFDASADSASPSDMLQSTMCVIKRFFGIRHCDGTTMFTRLELPTKLGVCFPELRGNRRRGPTVEDGGPGLSIMVLITST